MGDGDVCENWEQFSEDNERLEKELEKLTMDKPKHNTRNPGNCTTEATQVNHTTSTANDVPAPGGTTPQFRILLRKKDPVTLGIPATATTNPIPGPGIELDSTSEESLRTQYVPQLKILSRPKPSGENATSATSDRKQVTTKKSLEQREKEYSEARMRILGDVRFLEEEKEAELESSMTPAEILKMKVSRSLMSDEKVPSAVPSKSGDGTSEQSIVPNETQGGVDGGEGVVSKSKKRRSRSKVTPNPVVAAPLHFPPSKSDSERIVRQPRGPDGTTGFNSPR